MTNVWSKKKSTSVKLGLASAVVIIGVFASPAAYAGDNVKAGVKKAEAAVHPHQVVVSSGTFKNSGNTARQPLPLGRALPPSPPRTPAVEHLSDPYKRTNTQGRDVNPNRSGPVAAGWDAHQKAHGK